MTDNKTFSAGDREYKKFSGNIGSADINVNDVTQATRAQTVTSEVLTLSAGAAGTTGKVRVRYAPIKDTIGANTGYYKTALIKDTSLSITHLALAGDEIEFNRYTDDASIYATLSNGDYTVDYVSGTIYYKKGTADTAGTIGYIYANQDVNISMGSISIGDVTSNSQNIATQTTSAAILAKQTDKLQMTQITDGTHEADVIATINSLKSDVSSIGGTAINAANTARTTGTLVLPVQGVGADGTVYPTGSLNTNAPFTKLTDGSVNLGFGTDTMANSIPVTLATDDTQFGSIGAAADVDGNIHGQLRYIGEAVDGLEATVPTPSAEYLSPTDFTVAYTSNVTITLSSLPISITDSSQIVYIKFIPTGGSGAKVLVCGQNGVTITHLAGVLTVNGAGTPFAAGDVYEVGINAVKKAYDSTTDSYKIIDQSPDSSKYIIDSLLDTTNVTAATNYYPSATGMSMDGYRDWSLTGKFIDADNTTTLSWEGTNDEDTTNADWISFYGYDSKNNTIVSSIVCTNTTVTFALDFDNCNYSSVRVKIVNGDDTNTMIVKSRRKAL